MTGGFCMDRFIKLRDILEKPDTYLWSDALFLPEGEEWTLNTLGLVLNPDDVENDEDEVPLSAKEHSLICALSIQDIQSITDNAHQQKSDCTSEELLTSYLYYYDNDAFINFRVDNT